MKKTVKTIFTLLILFSTSDLFAQNLRIEIGDYPLGLGQVMKQYDGISKDDLEIWNFDLEGESVEAKNPRGVAYSIYRNSSMYLSVEQDKGDKMVIRDGDLKKYGSFKVNYNGRSSGVSPAFSSNGKSVMAFSLGTDGQLYYYLYDIATKELVVDQKISMDSALNEILSVRGNGFNDLVCITTYTGKIVIVDTKSFTGITYSLPITKAGPFDGQYADLHWYFYIYPSLISDHFMVANDFTRILFDAKEGKMISQESHDGNRETPTTSAYVANSPEDRPFTNIGGRTLSSPGIGAISTDNSLLVFDTDMNYFTLSKDGETDVLDYVSFNGDETKLEPQPDPIPIISDVLSTEKTVALLDKLAFVGQVHRNRKMIFQVFESIEPFSNDLLHLSTRSQNSYVVEYMGKYVTKLLNDTPKLTLSEGGKEKNVQRMEFLKLYLTRTKQLSKEEYGAYLADQTEIEAAIEKIEPLTGDLYYMSTEELMASGNKSIGMVNTMGSSAALLAIKFYKVAAEKEPTEPVYPILIGNAYANADDYDNALAYYNKALAIRPDYPLALFGMTKTSFMPVQKGQKALDDNLAKSIIGNANRFLAVAPDDYIAETKSTNIYKSICQLYLDDQGLYASYNLATGLSDTEKRVNAVSTLIPKVKATGNTFLTAYLANINGFDYIKFAESKANNVNDYKQADKMLKQSVMGGVYDAETYYKWAQININFLDNKSEGMRIVSEAQKMYPEDKNFGSLMANEYFNKGREYYLNKSYSSAIPMFEKYIANAKNIVPKAYDYLGFSYYYTKNYVKAAENLQLVKDKNDVNTLLAYSPNFNEVLAYAKNPSGTRPIPKDNGDMIVTMEDLYMKGNDMAKAGQTYEGLKLMEEAAAYYDQINYDYGQAITHSGVGVTYHNADDTSNAKSHYETCVESGPQSSTCYYNLALILIKEEQLGKAKSLVNEGLRAYPNAEDLAKAKQYLNE